MIAALNEEPADDQPERDHDQPVDTMPREPRADLRHFESVGPAFPALLLVLMAAIIGFCESGDLFNMFVFFELTTATAIALTAHRSDQRAPLQGALNFGISNAIGGFFVLFGMLSCTGAPAR